MRFKILFLLAMLVSLQGGAREFIYNGLTFTVLDEDLKTCEIVGTWDYETQTNSNSSVAVGSLVLPQNPMDGDTQFTLTSIGAHSFQYCQELTAVVIPSTVGYIGMAAFFQCTNLSYVSIGDGVKTIDDYAFTHCHALTSVFIPNSVTNIGEAAFWYCSSMTDLTIGSSVTSIGDEAFANCSALTRVNYLPLKGVEASESIFSDDTYANAKLHITPSGDEDDIRSTMPWSKFAVLNITGVDDVNVSATDGVVEVYNLRGVKVASAIEGLPAGVYIVRQGSHVTKVVVK